jgi:cytochrome c
MRVVAAAALALLAALAPARADPAGHGGPVRALAVAEGGLVASGGFDSGVVLWPPGGGAAARRLTGHDAAVNGVVVAPDGARAVSVGDDGLAIGWDLAAGAERWRVATGAKLAAAAASPDGTLAAVASWDGTVRLLRTADGAPAAELDLGRGRERATGVAFVGPGGELVAAAGHLGTVRVWRAADGSLAREWRSPGLGVAALAGAAGGLIAAGGPDRGVRLWDAATGEPRGGELVGHGRPVSALALSRDGRWLASGAVDGQLVLWDVATGRPVAEALAGKGPVWALAFGARELHAGGMDGVVRRWSVPALEPLGRPPARVAVAAAPVPAGHERGAALFRACAVCHTLTPDGGNRAGPSLLGVLGRRAGTLPGYAYSPALAGSGIVWTEETVGRLFEVGPDVLTPGSKMPLQRVPDAADRAALVAYIRAAGERGP